MRSLVPYSSDSETPASSRRDPFFQLRSEMDRLFDSFGRWPGDISSDLTPRIDVSETEKEIDIDAELPGMEDKDIDVTLAGDMLTIKGEKKSEREEKDKNYRLSERSYGSFSRTIALPFDADPKNIKAEFNKGVLHIVVPKPDHVTSKTAKIPVRAK